MKSTGDLARGWFLKADSDLASAERTIASEGPFDTACFHAQQCTEKYLKGFLAYHGLPIPRTHDLEELHSHYREIEPAPNLTDLELAELSGYAVEMRYDAEFWPERDTAQEALSVAGEVRSRLLAVLPSSTHPHREHG